MEALTPLRIRIDEIDEAILRLLNERAGIVLEVGRIKNIHQAPLHVPEREAAILKRLVDNNPGPFPNPAVVAVFKELISACLNMEGPIRVAYLGPEATYTHLAARHYFGSGCTFLPYSSIPEVVNAVTKGDAIYGMVPVENSSQGSVALTLDAVGEAELTVCGEAVEPIHHCLLARDAKLGGITQIFGHAQSLAQCREWLHQHLPGIGHTETTSNAAAAQRAAKTPGHAAIASALAADVYKLSVLADNIQDCANNRTRFWAIAKEARKPSGNDKTSILVSVKDESGSLYAMLSAFERNGISLAKIESRPAKLRPWEYLFFIDLKGHHRSDQLQAALADVAKVSLWVKILGSYPIAQENA